MPDSTQETDGAVTSAAARIVAAARSQLGVPYVYGGEEPGVGFDCSGLTQWACGQAGLVIPRGSAAQFTGSGPKVTGALEPGDLVFFYGGESSGPRPGHVGIAISATEMIDAPYTGVDVRYDSFSASAVVGPLDYYGATRPAALAGPTPPPPHPPNVCSVQLLVLQEGMKGYAVKSLQMLLNGYDMAELVTDAEFGPLTRQAVVNWQHKLDYTEDGIVGKQTWTSLLGAVN